MTATGAPALLRPVAADVRETTEIGRFLGWLERERARADLRRLRRPARLVGEGSRGILVARRDAVLATPLAAKARIGL